ncbi:uncharacterized protein [Diadema antillarum]|uniref:uncharacterized protein n=1 Tax=Diadema antillarum TaxID=105358 RepID=UPI003A8A361F
MRVVLWMALLSTGLASSSSSSASTTNVKDDCRKSGGTSGNGRSNFRYRRQVPSSSTDPHGHCGDEFPCINSTQCIPQRAICNGVVDCDNGSDESDEECFDANNVKIWDLFNPGKHEDSSEEESDTLPECEVGTYPVVCNCTLVFSDLAEMFNFESSSLLSDDIDIFTTPLHDLSMYPLGLELACLSRRLDDVPRSLPNKTISLDLSNNSITHLRSDNLKDLTDLRHLTATHNKMKIVDNDTFHTTLNLESLDLSDNRIEEFSSTTFRNLRRLSSLRLSRNHHLRCRGGRCFRNLVSLRELVMVSSGIDELEPGMFKNLRGLEVLQLSSNAITEIRAEHFQGLDGLQDLHLDHNQISYIGQGVFEEMDRLLKLILHNNMLTNVSTGLFAPLPRLAVLKLDENFIHTIEPGSFAAVRNVVHFTIMNNHLREIKVGMFEGLGNVTTMSLRNNEISAIEEHSFDPMRKLESLDLQKNKLTEVPRGLFETLKRLNNIYFDYFFMCGYAPNVRVCSPKGDGISTAENLLGNWVLRAAVWLVALLGSLGNLLVILARCFVSEDNKVHSFFIMNLAVADFLMGLYLLVIGLHDVMFRGKYIFNDLDWRSGWVCRMCGLLSLLSSEMSVLTLTVITSDRFISIVHPFKFRQRHLAHAVSLMVAFWLAAMLIAILPVLHRPYFGEFFYGGNGVCLPLQFDRPFDDGWEFTLVVFVLFNLFAFLFILYAYAQMFATVRKSSLAMRSTKESQDWNLLKRFTIIVATDFICWMPIILVKIASYAGVAIPQSVHAWFAVFVLPVNSALNPILYTVTTQFFRQRFVRPVSRLCGRRKPSRTYTSGSYEDSVTGTKISATKLSIISHNGKPRAGSLSGRLNSTRNHYGHHRASEVQPWLSTDSSTKPKRPTVRVEDTCGGRDGDVVVVHNDQDRCDNVDAAVEPLMEIHDGTDC